MSPDIYLNLHSALLIFHSLSVLQKSILVLSLYFVVSTINSSISRWKSWVCVPIAGPYSGPISAYYGAIKFFTNGREMIDDGYRKSRGRIFKIPMLKGWRLSWHVFVASPELIDEIQKLGEEYLSPLVGNDEHLKAEYTLGMDHKDDLFHLRIIQQHLTRNIGNVFPDLMDELRLVFEDSMPLFQGGTSYASDEPWTSIKASEVFTRMISRTANRVLVGAPLCRNEEFIKIIAQYAIDAFIGAKLLDLVPEFMRPLVAKYLIRTTYTRRRFAELVRPTVDDRLRRLSDSNGDFDSLPNDSLTWLLKEAPLKDRNLDAIVKRILFINIVAINTTSQFFTKVVLFLASYPDYISPIRQELESTLGNEGWSKASLSKCHKLDSFCREVFRVSPIVSANHDRSALKDFTFSDGTVIREGTVLSVALAPIQVDPLLYGETADKFDGFRWSDTRERTTESWKHQAIQTSSDYLTFGYGKHACPGRFFAINELKVMVSYLLLHYDIKYEDQNLRRGQLPKEHWFGIMAIPTEAKLRYRSRQ